jgi:tRNA pseudouridine32 synthase/23S rRNA pseudouridine746 synthase
MAAIGHPILGDALYGNAASAPRLMLHATTLDLMHPLSGAPLQFIISAPF